MDYRGLNDGELTEKIKEGDNFALSELINRYQNKIYRYVLRIVKDHDESLDITQEVFIKVYENIQGFDSERKFSSWLYRIAHNHAINTIKKKKRVLNMEIPLEKWLADEKEKGEDFLEKENREELTKDMLKKLENLRQEYKDVLMLYYFEEKDYDEISDILMIPTSTVGVWLKRAKEALKKKIYDRK